jgi:hypothetical protein
MDPDPDHAIVVIDLQDAANKKLFFLFSANYFSKVHLNHCSMTKNHKEHFVFMREKKNCEKKIQLKISRKFTTIISRKVTGGGNLRNFKKFSLKGKLFRVNKKMNEIQHFLAGIAKTKFAAL